MPKYQWNWYLYLWELNILLFILLFSNDSKCEQTPILILFPFCFTFFNGQCIYSLLLWLNFIIPNKKFLLFSFILVFSSNLLKSFIMFNWVFYLNLKRALPYACGRLSRSKQAESIWSFCSSTAFWITDKASSSAWSLVLTTNSSSSL